MIKVGLTGGIGSGKSTVSKMIMQESIPIIDADIISREVLYIYPEIIHKVKNCFGEEYIDDDGSLKRKKLGNLIFNDKDKRFKLENIIIPYIKKEIFKRIEECEKKGKDICVVDAPTLIEHNLHKYMDANILVWVDVETQILRVMKRDKLTRDEVLDRIYSQMLLSDKEKEVEYILDNTGELKKTKTNLEKILDEIKRVVDRRKNEGQKEA